MNQKKKGRELIHLMMRSYLTHGPFNVTCMQIMRCKGMHAKVNLQCKLFFEKFVNL
jgi:hypothetical protein